MRTATSVSAGEAAKRLGRAKSTITRAIHAGDLSAFKDADGRYWIEPAELVRAFPDATLTDAAPVQNKHDETSRTGAKDEDKPLQRSAKPEDATRGAHQVTIDALKRQIETAEEERNRERRQLEGTISDLRGRLDQSETERRATAVQLTALLTDQTAKAEAAIARPVVKRSLWHRLVGATE